MRDAIQMHFPDLGDRMVFDRRVDGGCSRRRPDVWIDCYTHVVIVECDERRHAGYSCETKRMMELFQDLGNRPAVFVRFNPDAYRDAAGRQIGGAFRRTTTGDGVNAAEWRRRAAALVDTVRNALQTIPAKEVTVEYLFYE